MTAPCTRRQGPWISPVVPVIVSAFFVLTRLGQEGLGNEYYADAVRSMLQSGQNLFYATFDPAGFLAVDRLPVGLWLQTRGPAGILSRWVPVGQSVRFWPSLGHLVPRNCLVRGALTGAIPRLWSGRDFPAGPLVRAGRRLTLRLVRDW
jgi:4-amino-4-deoxy-L-arabinose transferase-like glycosyltransferase